MDGSTAENECPEFLDPAEESPLTGVVRGFDTAPTKFNKSCVIVTLEVDGVPRSLWLTSTVLRSQFARLRPEVGETITVEYLGKRDGVNAECHNYKVTAPNRPPFVPDWESLGDEELEDESE
jgi:hypothetical protein